MKYKKFSFKKALSDNGTKTFRNSAPVVSLLAGLLILATLIGCVHVFLTLPGKALASMSTEERRSLSVMAVPDGTGIDDVLIAQPVSVFGSVKTADGKELFSAVEPYANIDEAFGSLVGSVNDVGTDDTRYIINNYADSLFPVPKYTPGKGILDSAKDIELTLNYDLQEDVYELMKELNVVGSCCVYNYMTGDTLAAVSTPGWGCEGNGSYVNRNLFSVTPGSTMKLITLYLLLDQGIDVNKSYTCTGSYKLPDGKTIKCSGIHNTVPGASDAIGLSCNTWFASMVKDLDLYRAKTTLHEMGFRVNDDPADALTLGELPCNVSSVVLDGNSWTFSNIWNLIGQDAALVSPITMISFVSECVTVGNAVLPRLTTDENACYSAYAHEHAENYSKVYELWQAGYQAYYGSDYNNYISAAKTGTADFLGTPDAIQKSLSFVSKEFQVAGYINIENYADCKIMPVEICNRVMQVLASMQ